MENRPSAFVMSLGYGALISLVLIVFYLLMFILGLDKKMGIMWLSYLILIAGLVLAQMNYRNKYLGGFISYGQSFTIGLLTSIIIGIVTGIWTYIFLKYINPGAIEEGMRMAEQRMMDKGMSDTEIDQGMVIARKFASVGIYTVMGFLSNIFFGIIISLISSIFVKKEEGGFNQPAA